MSVKSLSPFEICTSSLIEIPKEREVEEFGIMIQGTQTIEGDGRPHQEDFLSTLAAPWIYCFDLSKKGREAVRDKAQNKFQDFPKRLLSSEFIATLNFPRVKVPLNPMYYFFENFAKSYVLSC